MAGRVNKVKAIFLTGFMGSGKTTVGKVLGKHLQLQVIDTDEYIESARGCSVREIFSQEGEAQFRIYEREYLKELPNEDFIITTGGGIVIQKENREWMKENGIVVYLHCKPKVLLKRLENDTTRPLLDGDKKNNIEKIFKKRLPFYNEADFVIDTTTKSVDQIIKEIEKVINDVKDGNTI